MARSSSLLSLSCSRSFTCSHIYAHTLNTHTDSSLLASLFFFLFFFLYLFLFLICRKKHTKRMPCNVEHNTNVGSTHAESVMHIFGSVLMKYSMLPQPVSLFNLINWLFMINTQRREVILAWDQRLINWVSNLAWCWAQLNSTLWFLFKSLNSRSQGYGKVRTQVSTQTLWLIIWGRWLQRSPVSMASGLFDVDPYQITKTGRLMSVHTR